MRVGSYVGTATQVEELPPITFVGQPSVFANCVGTQGTEVVCWGQESNLLPLGIEEQGIRTRRSFRMRLPEPAVASVATARSVCALTRTGHVYCWGGNTSGILVGLSLDVTSAMPIAIRGPKD